ncbi:Methanogenic corrinoid protein MtbC1 [Desulfocicer vacuolatum DSM 3385]|uniref:Methanogenic corrinoid protein MtbC1 n=2 Tax=Desulfocicer vacuolatum TaxID=2298 RepID=A0A1W2DWZ8_9BACT|nr:Methanogenic corrinoid protein MtbC1 [Desulfocicer vacuolatum DSM 3385]
MLSDIQQKVLAQLMEGNRVAVIDLIDEWAVQKQYRTAVSEILEPVLHEFGERWYRGEGLSLSHGYIAGKIAEYLMEKCLEEEEQNDAAPRKKKGNLVIGNIEDDYHSLGRMMLGRFLEISHWQVHDLGNDVLAEEFVDKALEVRSRVIAVSAMMYTNALNIQKLRREIDDRGLGGVLQLAVGGAVFITRPNLIREVGGDGTAVNAFKSVELIERMWQTSTTLGELP